MKTELTVLAEQRETTCHEREREREREKTSAVFTLLYLVFNWLSLPRRVRLPTNFQTHIVPLLLPGVGERNISVLGGFTQKIWNPRFFFLSFLITVQPITSALVWLTQRSVNSLSALSSYFFFSLSFPRNLPPFSF